MGLLGPLRQIRGAIARLFTKDALASTEAPSPSTMVTRQQLIDHLQFLNRSAFELIDLHDEDAIYACLGAQTHALLAGEVVVIVSRYTDDGQTMIVQHVHGLGEVQMRLAQQLMGHQVIGRRYPIDTVVTPLFQRGGLARIEGGLVGIAGHLLPIPLLRKVIRLLDIGEVYIIGLQKDGVLYAGMQLYMRGARIIEYPELLEALVQQAATALERVRAVKAQHQIERRYRALFDGSLNAVFLHDLEGNFIDANDAALKLMGYSRDDLPRLNFAALLAPDDLPMALATLHEVLETGTQRQPAQVTLRRSDGALVSVETISSIIRDGDDAPIVQGIAYDITERMQMLDTLRRSEANLRAMLASTWQNFTLIDREYRVIEANEATRKSAEAIFGKRMEPGDSIYDYVLPQDHESFTRNYQKALNGESLVIEKSFPSRVGDMLSAEIIYYPVIDSAGDIIGVCMSHRDITERKQMEAALRHSEERYKEVVDAQSDLICRYLPDTTLVFVNEAYCRYFGKTREELIGTSFMDLIPEEGGQRDRTIERYISLLENPRQDTHEHMALTPGGALRWQEWVDTVLTDAGGNPIEVQAVGRDITERKRMEDQLREREESFRALVENTPDLVARIARDSTHIYVNRAFAAVMGLPVEAIIGKTNADLGVPEEAQHYLDAIREQIYTTGEPAYMELTYTVNGEERQYHLRLVPEFDAEGAVSTILSVSRDITERKHMEDQLRDINRRYDELVNNIPVMVYRVRLTPDFQYSFDYVSPSCKVFTGYEAEDVMRDSTLPRSNLSPEVDAEHWRLLLESRDTLTPFLFEGPCTVRGEPRWIRLQSRPRRLDNGDVVWDGIHQDITEHKLAEQRAFELALEKERLQLLMAFIQDAAHEFRTPLSNIAINIYLMQRLDDVQRRIEKAQQTEAQIQRIVRLVDMLLMMARLDSNSLPPHMPLSVEPIIEAICYDARSTYGDQPQLYCIAPHQPLPPVQGDAEYLTEALRQIIDNAYRFTPPDGAITIRSGVTGDEVWVEISDTGPGIPDELLPHIFKTFWRKDTAHTTPGFGLGLSIAQKIVANHQGMITVSSTSDSGSHFQVSLPALQGPLPRIWSKQTVQGDAPGTESDEA